MNHVKRLVRDVHWISNWFVDCCFIYLFILNLCVSLTGSQFTGWSFLQLCCRLTVWFAHWAISFVWIFILLSNLTLLGHKHICMPTTSQCLLASNQKAPQADQLMMSCFSLIGWYRTPPPPCISVLFLLLFQPSFTPSLPNTTHFSFSFCLLSSPFPHHQEDNCGDDDDDYGSLTLWMPNDNARKDWKRCALRLSSALIDAEKTKGK